MNAEWQPLLDQAAAGRKFWIGLFPEPNPALKGVMMLMQSANAARLEEVIEPESAHITVKHAGRCNSNVMLSLLEAAENLTKTISGCFSVRTDAVLRLSRHLALAIEPKNILWLSQSLDDVFEGRAKALTSFSGLPHLTVGKILPGHSVKCFAIEPIWLTFKGLTAVCGDAKLLFPFAESVF